LEDEESSLQKVVEIFKSLWEELAEEYGSKRRELAYLCEGDVQLHLASKLLSKMPDLYVHINLPIPIKVKRFYKGLELLGRPPATPKEHIKPDIVIMDEYFSPCLISEIKFTPFYLGFIPRENLLSKVQKEELRKLLTADINCLERLRRDGPSKKDIDRQYLGNIGKLIEVLKNFKREEGIDVAGYLCVIDELFPDLEERLKQAVKKYDPPTQFEVLVEHFDLMESLEQIRKKVG